MVFSIPAGVRMTTDQLAGQTGAARRMVPMSAMGRYRARACTHLDVISAGIEHGPCERSRRPVAAH